MERIPDLEAIAGLYMFRGVPRRALSDLLSLAPPVRYQPGEVVFRQGEPADVGLLLVEGRLVVSVKVEALVRQVGDVRPGEVVGETALFNINGRRSATVVASEPSSALKLSWYLLERAPQNAAVMALEQHLLGALVRRIRKTNQAIGAEWRLLSGPTPAPEPTQPEPPLARQSLLGRLMGLFGGQA